MAALPLPDFKEVIKLIKKGATVEAQEEIMRQREYVVALREENIELREKITKLESAENIKQNLIFRDGRYYLKREVGVEDGPYCQRCWDSDGKLIRLQVGTGSDYDNWVCFVCNKFFKKN